MAHPGVRPTGASLGGGICAARCGRGPERGPGSGGRLRIRSIDLRRTSIASRIKRPHQGCPGEHGRAAECAFDACHVVPTWLQGGQAFCPRRGRDRQPIRSGGGGPCTHGREPSSGDGGPWSLRCGGHGRICGPRRPRRSHHAWTRGKRPDRVVGGKHPRGLPHGEKHRCARHVDGGSQGGADGQVHRQHELRGGHGAVPLWRQSHLSPHADSFAGSGHSFGHPQHL